MSRLTPISKQECTPEQSKVIEAVTGGKRSTQHGGKDFLAADGAMRGPFNAMVHSPTLGLVLQRLGEILRYEGALEDDAREIAILVVAAHWQARYEWWAHARIAREAGISDEVLDALARKQAPRPGTPLLKAVHSYASELVHDHRVSDATYAEASQALGESALVELTIVLGYYTTISMILNAFAVPLPGGESTPFEC